MEGHSGQYEMSKTAHPAKRDASPTYDSQSFEKDSDAHSEDFQDGVQRVRAITEIWSRKTLGTMFVLYVRNKAFTLRAPTLTKQSVLGAIRGRTSALSTGCTQPLHHIIVPSAWPLDDCRRRCKYHEWLLQAHTRQIRGHLWAH